VVELDAPAEEELGRRLERLRGEIELPVPAASAVKIGGERAYRLARKGVAVEMPVRRSVVFALDVISYTGDDPVTAVQLDVHVSSGTYVRALADALGGHCTSLRRTWVGPFSVEEAADVTAVELKAPSEALARLPAEAVERVPAAVRAGVLALEHPTGGGAA
jgi:tRNA pseudouridine55 synthase